MTELFSWITAKTQSLSDPSSLQASSADRRTSLQSNTEELTPRRKKSFCVVHNVLANYTSALTLQVALC